MILKNLLSFIVETKLISDFRVEGK